VTILFLLGTLIPGFHILVCDFFALKIPIFKTTPQIEVFTVLGCSLLQFTKQGSIFVCIRLVDTTLCKSTQPGVLEGEGLLHLVDSTDPKAEEYPLYPMTVYVDGVQYNPVLVLSGDSSKWPSRSISAPRLSMKNGPLSCHACVKRWRDWSPKSQIDSSGTGEVTLVVSIEDTGKDLYSKLDRFSKGRRLVTICFCAFFQDHVSNVFLFLRLQHKRSLQKFQIFL
jgi:hypothetical protein